MIGHRVSQHSREQEKWEEGREKGIGGEEDTTVLIGWSGVALQRRWQVSGKQHFGGLFICDIELPAYLSYICIYLMK